MHGRISKQQGLWEKCLHVCMELDIRTTAQQQHINADINIQTKVLIGFLKTKTKQKVSFRRDHFDFSSGSSCCIHPSIPSLLIPLASLFIGGPILKAT